MEKNASNQSIDRMFQILETMTFTGRPMRLNDIAEKSGIPASTAMRILNAMIENGYANQNVETQLYSLSYKFLWVGNSIRENLSLNPDIPANIRWIVDDVTKFCQREVRRGSKYQLIAMDPPTFGRGSKAQVWKIEDDLVNLLKLCRQMTDDNKPFRMVLSSHSPGFSVRVLSNMIEDVFGRGNTEGEEMTVMDSTGRWLPAGVTVSYSR